MKCISTVLALAVLLSASQSAEAQPTLSSPVVSPEVGMDGKVTFRLRSPNLKDVKITGDFTAKDVAMKQGENGDWSYTTEALAPGLYGYYFKLDGLRVPDPGNLFVSSSADYLKSYFEVKRSKDNFWALRDVPHGTLHENLYKSPALGTTRRVIVYTPPGYDPAGTKLYPVVFLYHGSGDNETMWSHVGRAHYIMDNLLAEGKAKPAILVMPYGHTTLPKGSEGGKNGVELYEVSKIEKELLESVIPLIEKEYRVSKQAKDRAITGISMGGYQALTIGLNNSSVIGNVAGFGAGFRVNQDLQGNFKTLLANKEQALKQLKSVNIMIGDNDPGLKANEQVFQFLTQNRIPSEIQMTAPGGHSWLTWRGHFRDWVSKLFADH